VPTRDTRGQAEAYVAAISSKEEMFQAIVDERALEFCGEFLRKGDLIRWNLLKTNLDAAIDDMLALRDLQGAYAGLTGDIAYAYADDSKSIKIPSSPPRAKSRPGQKSPPVM
jgi:SusD family.